jgi:ligand-binding sensor domain-containing protein/serine phosphatase RsbU (regulator of sigma subunit)
LWQHGRAQSIKSFGHRVNFKHYSNESGFFSTNIRCLFQDSKGKIWVGCQDGLYVFNGNAFTNLSAAMGFDAYDVGSVCEDDNGGIWIGTNVGVFLYKNKMFKAMDTTGHRMPKKMSWAMYKDTDGTMWAGTHAGLFHFDPKKPGDPLIHRYRMPGEDPSNNIIRFVKRKKNGDLVIGAENGYYKYKPDTFYKEFVHGGAVYSLIELDNNKDWISGWGSPALQLSNYKQDSVISVGSGILKMTKDNHGDIWLVTFENGIFRFNGKDIIKYSTPEGLDYNSFWTCMTDREGNVWFGSFGNGLYKYSGDGITLLNEKNGLYNGLIGNMIQDSIGTVWIQTENSVSRYDPATRSISNYTASNNTPFTSLQNIYTSVDEGPMAMSYLGSGYSFRNGKVKESPGRGGLQALNGDSGKAYIVRDYGIFCRHMDGSTYTIPEHKKYRGGFTSIFKSRRGNFWISNYFNGLYYFDGKTRFMFNEMNGFRKTASTAIHEATSGELWVGTKTKGVLKCILLNDTTMKVLDSITTANGLRSNFITSIDVYRGKMYIGSKYGLGVLDLKQYAANRKRVKLYTADEGLVNSSASVCFIDKESKLWIATPEGAYIFDTRVQFPNTQEPTTQITNIQLLYEDQDWMKMGFALDNNDLPIALKLPYDQNHFTFQFTGISHTAPTKVRYRYMLAGSEDAWSPITAKNEITYSNLAPGTYTFMVKACNNDEVWNADPVAFVFTITPPFWKTRWFISVLVLLGITMIFLTIRYREKKLRHEKHVLEEKVNERTIELKVALEQVEEKQKEIIDSLNYAKRLQKAILASEKTLRSVFEQSFILFKPKDIVSGDFYWMVHLEEKKIEKNIFVFAAADCTGHGVPGAFMSMLNSTLLNQTVYNPKVMTPADVLNFMNEELPKNLRASEDNDKIQDGMDIAFGIIDINKSTLKFCGANNPCWIIRNGELIELEPVKQAITASTEYEKKTFVDQEIEIQKGDSIYVFTDGYADQFGGPKGKKFKYKTLANLLLSSNHESLPEQRKTLERTFEEWKGSLEQVDDVCMIGIRI